MPQTRMTGRNRAPTPAVTANWTREDTVPLRRALDAAYGSEQHYAFAERPAAMARRLQARATHGGLVIDGEIAIAADQHVNGGADTVRHQDR